MSSLRKYTKNTVAQNKNGMDYSVKNKQFWYSFYMEYFVDLITNYFEWENMPESIDKLFLEKILCFNGYAGFINDPTYGLIVSRGTMGEGLDIYDNPTFFRPINNRFINFRKIPINWYSDNLDKEKAIIIGNNNFYRPSTTWLSGFCEKLADIEQTIQLNRNAQIKPYVIIAEQQTLFSMKNLWNKILNQDPVIYVNKQKSSNGGIENTQLTDLVQILETNTPFLLDKLHDEKQRVINQVLTFIGINNNAVDKAERLVQAEATSNNGLINASIEIGLKAREISAERINMCHDLDIKVAPTDNIRLFNTEQIIEDTDEKIDEITEVE